MIVPSRAPTSDTSPPKTGMALAMTYDVSALPAVHPIQVIQWVGVLLARCFDPRRILMKKYFAANLNATLATKTIKVPFNLHAQTM